MSSTSSPSNDLYAVADFCLVPIGTGEPSVAEYVAECVRVLEKTGLKFKVEVMQAIHACHAAVHAKGAPRIATDIRIGTRVDREITPGTGNEGKVKRVEEILSRDQTAGTQ
ncbi:YkoF-like protein [Trametes sanguinea]|nr:YkoF-like protein [Trametes sanguinea]